MYLIERLHKQVKIELRLDKKQLQKFKIRFWYDNFDLAFKSKFMKWFMKSIEIKFRYWGDTVKANVFQQEDARGVIYPIKLNGDYFFTLRYDEQHEWMVEKEKNGISPRVDKELLSRILKPLETKLRFAA